MAGKSCAAAVVSWHEHRAAHSGRSANRTDPRSRVRPCPRGGTRGVVAASCRQGLGVDSIPDREEAAV